MIDDRRLQQYPAPRRRSPGRAQQHLEASRMEGSKGMKYLVVVEKAGGNYSAYVPDLPDCVATGATVEETQRNIREAIATHIEGLRKDGLPVPEPQTQAEFVET